jgi:hypothetical protein
MFRNTLKYILIILFICITLALNAIEKKDSIKTIQKTKERKLENFVFGGSIGLLFGNITLVDVSPTVGYFVTPKTLMGLGLTYQYYSQKWYDKRISSNIYGGRIYNEYIIYDNLGTRTRMKSNFAIYTHIEYEALNMDRDFSDNTNFGKISRFWLHGFLPGGGIKQMIGKRSSLNISILYNIIHDPRSPYDNLVLRIGFYI